MNRTSSIGSKEGPAVIRNRVGPGREWSGGWEIECRGAESAMSAGVSGRGGRGQGTNGGRLQCHAGP